MSADALSPDEIAVSYQVREFGPLRLDELYARCFVDHFPVLKPIVDRTLADLVDKKEVVLENRLYRI